MGSQASFADGRVSLCGNYPLFESKATTIWNRKSGTARAESSSLELSCVPFLLWQANKFERVASGKAERLCLTPQMLSKIRKDITFGKD